MHYKPYQADNQDTKTRYFADCLKFFLSRLFGDFKHSNTLFYETLEFIP